MAEHGHEAEDELSHVHLRASHADRERVIDVLKAAFVQGRLTKDEFDARVGQALASRTDAELAAVAFDLPAGPAAAPPAGKPAGEKAQQAGPIRLITAATVLTAGVWAVVLSAQSDNGGLLVLLFSFTFAWLGSLILSGAVMLEHHRQRRSSRPLAPPPASGRGSQGPAGQLWLPGHGWVIVG
jgi:hypothetical protein